MVLAAQFGSLLAGYSYETAGWLVFGIFGLACLLWPAGAGTVWNKVIRADPPLESSIIRLLGAVSLVAALAWKELTS